jgi:CRISP-associated protein Cas1
MLEHAGIMALRAGRSPAFEFGTMELERPKVDRAVLDSVKAHAFDPADLVIRDDGICRLN